MQEEVDKHKAVLRDQERKFVAQRLTQDATQMVTASCDAGNTISDCRRFSMEDAWCVPGERPHRTKHTELERNVEQFAARSEHWQWYEIELGEGGGAVFTEAVALHHKSVDRLMQHAEMQHRLRCMTPCRQRASPRPHRSWQQKQLEPVRVGTVADTTYKPWNRFASEGHSPSRVRTGGDQSSGQGASIHATAGEEAAGGRGEE